MKKLLSLLAIVMVVGCAHLYQADGEWQSVVTKGTPHPRHEAAFIEYKGKFYALGGRRVQPVDIFDPETNTWSHGAQPPFQIHHFQPVIYKDAIILSGAMTGGYPGETPIPNLMYYYPEQDKWKIGEPIPKHRLRGGAGSVVFQDKLYLISGIKNGHIDGHVPWLDVYDFKTRQWSELPDAPRSRDHFQSAVLDGQIYAVGGRNTSKATNEVFTLTIDEVNVFDIERSTWRTLPKAQNLPTQRAGSMTLAIGDEIWVFGGETLRALPAHNEVEAYNPKLQQWRSITGFKEGRHGTGVIMYKGSLWTALGSGATGGKPELSSMEKLTLINQ